MALMASAGNLEREKHLCGGHQDTQDTMRMEDLCKYHCMVKVMAVPKVRIWLTLLREQNWLEFHKLFF